jgi:hypothetical protein
MRRDNKPYWSESFRLSDSRVYAWERLERGGHVFVLLPATTGKKRRTKLRLGEGIGVRDERGRIDKRKVQNVRDEVQQLVARIVLGQPARTVERSADTHGTLAEGFSAVLDLKSGKFPTKTRRWDEIRRAARELERLLGPHTRWADLQPSDARRVWRSLAEEAKRQAGASNARGARQAEVTLDALYSSANWLRDDGLIPQSAALPQRNWRKRLKEDWQRITGDEVTVSRPRHTDEEMRRLFAHMHDPGVDPRFALAFDLGGEQRLGQVLRCWRSDLTLPPVNHDTVTLDDSGALGVVRVHGVGKKMASPIALTPGQRSAVERALAGFLSDYEAAWRSGAIPDYPLFPSGRFCKGKSKVIANAKCLTRDAALGMFHDLEGIAKVASVPGRGWYGVRRIATDVGEDFEKDERVLNSISGHTDSATRRQVYQERERPSVLRQAAITRDRIRRGSAAVVATPEAEKARKGA